MAGTLVKFFFADRALRARDICCYIIILRNGLVPGIIPYVNGIGFVLIRHNSLGSAVEHELEHVGIASTLIKQITDSFQDIKLLGSHDVVDACVLVLIRGAVNWFACFVGETELSVDPDGG